MANSADFESFLKDINPSESTISEASRLHRNLRDHLQSCESYKSVYSNSYLSGSYAKHTFIRPKKNSDSCDIDVVVETTHDTDETPYNVLVELRNAILERSCYRNVRVQSHSVGIDLANFHIDVVPLVKDQEGNLYIGSKDEGTWQRTNPKAHISWSTQINNDFELNYKPLVKVLKWWRRENCPESAKFPKGITLEKMIADNLPELGLSIEERVMQTMANLSSAYSADLELQKVPCIEDPVLVGNDLAASYSLSDFKEFTSKLEEHLELLAEEGTGNSTWKKILGSNFPSGNTPSDHALLSNKLAKQSLALSVSHKRPLEYPILPPKPNAAIVATVTLPTGDSYTLENDGEAIPKDSSILYRLLCAPVKGSTVKWRVTNTGEEAMRVCPRGGFEKPNVGRTSRYEKTAYTGKHYVECFVIKGNTCVRWTKPFFINVE